MKNYKRFATVAVATVMVAGNMFAAMAAGTEGGATGTGEYEGYVEEISVFSVDVPTDANATQGFNFFVDPNGLLAQTDYARIDGATEADFEENATLFFTRTPDADSTPAVVKYGKDSEAITLTNKSSYEVNVEVSATVAGAEKITLGEITDDTTAPTIDLAIVSGDDSAAITADGGKLEGKIAGADENFEIQWNVDEEKYVYAQLETPDENLWQTYSFNLTGACGGTWTAEQADVQPTVTLTWKVTNPMEVPTVPTTTATSITAGGDAVEIKIPDGITVEKIEKTKADGTYNALAAEYFTWEDIDGGKKLTVKASFKAQFGTGKKIKISFSEGDPIELNVQ